ncbi:VanZ family protein [Patescibacteria group bacterium]
MIKIIKQWGPVVLWMSLIFFLSHQSSISSEFPLFWDTIFRKTAHILEYAILTFLLIGALRDHGLSKKKILFLAITIAILYAISDEYHQSFILGRHGVISDVMIDSIGVLLSAWLCKINMM